MNAELLYETNLNHLRIGDYIMHISVFADRIETHPAFTDAPVYVPNAQKFRTYATELRQASEEASYNKRKAKEKDDKRAESQRDYVFAVQHAVMVAVHERNMAMLDSLELEPKQRAHTRSPKHQDIPGMPKLSVKNGKISGTMIATVNRDPATGSIHLQFTEDPGVDSSWNDLPLFYTCRMESGGFDPVKRYYFRARFENSAGVGPWSPIVNLVII